MKKISALILTLQTISCVYGQTWSAIGNGVPGWVNCFAVYNGELYVGGQFRYGFSAGLMKWNGNAFDTVPGTYLFGTSSVSAMAVYNNELYVGGGFCKNCSPDFSKFNYVAKWNGSTWDSLGAGFNNEVYSMCIYNNNLYMGGAFQNVNGIAANGIVKWDGNQMTSIGGGNGTVRQLKVYNNELYAAGNFSFAAINSMCIARWNDTIWKDVGSGGVNGTIYGMNIYNNELYIGGPVFTDAGGVTVNQIAKWNGTTWNPVGSGLDSHAQDIFALQAFNGELYAGGEFNMMDGDSMKGIARYNGSVWSSVGSGVDSTGIVVDTYVDVWGDTTYVYAPHRVYSMFEYNNELYVGGEFNMIGGVVAHSVAKYGNSVGINELTTSSTLFIYPNPTSDGLVIDNQKNIGRQSLQVFSLTGQLVYDNQNFTTKTIDVGNFDNGVYVLKLSDEQNFYTRKFVVSH